MAGQVLAVASGKGGVGKTTTVVNLGVVLRRADHTVALVDGDLGMANLGTMLGVDAESSIHDVLAGAVSVEDAVVEEAPGFGVLVGSPNLESYPDADPRELRGVLESLAESYDFVLVDTGAGMSHEDVLPLGLADRVVLVTTPEPAAIGDVRKTAELAGLAEGDIAGLVVSMAEDTTDATHVGSQVGVEVIGVIPFDHTVRESTASATPLEGLDPDSPAAVAYRQLADTLADSATATTRAPAAAGSETDDEDDDGSPPSADAAAAATPRPAATTAAESEMAADPSNPPSSSDGDAAEEGPSSGDTSSDGDEDGPADDSETPTDTDGDDPQPDDAVDTDDEPEGESAEASTDEAAEPVGEEAVSDDVVDEAVSDDDGGAAADDDEEADDEDYLAEFEDDEPASGGLLAKLGRLFR